MTTNGPRTAGARCGRVALLAMCTAVLWTCCAGAAAETNNWRPCRAAGQRRYVEDVPRTYGGGGGGGGGYDDFTGDDGGSAEVDADDDYEDNDDGGDDAGYFRLPVVDDKPKRGAGKPYEKKPELHRPAAQSYAVDAASGNGLRVDTTLLRGETIELPTYVNVPVTLRCRFEPVDGTDDKFDTVVEAMYPGHRDAPPPPPGSHASRILKQLMSSVEGWRGGVAHGSARPVRRASGNRFGRRARPDREDEIRQIIAFQRAAERMRRLRDPGPELGWPERFHGQSARLLQRYGGRSVPARKSSENQLVDHREAEQDVYDEEVYDQGVEDQQVDGRQAEQDYDRQVEPQIDDFQQVEPQIDDLQQVESQIDDSQQVESVNDSQLEESVDDSLRVESVDDSQRVESFDNSQRIERVDDQLQVDSRQDGLVEDRAAAEDVDDRLVQIESLQVEGQQPQRDTTTTTTTAPEIATTTIKSDFAKFRKGIPVRTFMEHAYTTTASPL